MDLYIAIKHIYPDINDDDFILKNDGEETYILEWKSDKAKPTDEELKAAHDIADPLVKKAIADEEEIVKLKEYLSSTDFYYIRQMETKEPLPVDVVTKRIEARKRLKELGL